MNSTMSPEQPCNGSNYKHNGHNAPAPTDWKWFHCRYSQKCIHIDTRCDMHPNPACIYEKDGILVAEDEEGCFDEYKRKGLVSKSAKIICSSPDHNIMSPAVLSTVYDWDNWDYNNNVTVIPSGTTVEIQGVRCDGVSNCWDGCDELFCGFNASYTAGIGKQFKHLESIKVLLKIYHFFVIFFPFLKNKLSQLE